MEEISDKFLKPVALKTATGFRYFDFNEIILFRANGHNVECITIESSLAIKIYHNLAYLEKKYCNELFCRCNKSAIVNIGHIRCLETKTRRIYLKNDIELEVSENFMKSLRSISKDHIWTNDKKK
jgi:DNA-binding LytR/AlgR family response regulator